MVTKKVIVEITRGTVSGEIVMFYASVALYLNLDHSRHDEDAEEHHGSGYAEHHSTHGVFEQ
jgi:hypothetical protein